MPLRPNRYDFPAIPGIDHTYVDDHPTTGTPEDVLNAALYVRDDDTGVGQANEEGMLFPDGPETYDFDETSYSWNSDYGTNLSMYTTSSSSYYQTVSLLQETMECILATNGEQAQWNSRGIVSSHVFSYWSSPFSKTLRV